MLTDRLVKETREKIAGQSISDVVIGLGYTAVRLDDGSYGLAATLRNEVGGCCTLLDEAGRIADNSTGELLNWLTSTEALRASVGLATLNAITNRGVESNSESPLDALGIGETDVVGMIGFFGPLIQPARERSKELLVFERRQVDEDYVYPDWAVNSELPKCDVVIISSTTFINKTVDHLLDLSSGRIALLGPSTPMARCLKCEGISHLFGIEVVDPEKVLKIVTQAGGTLSFGSCVEKINLRL